MKPGEYTIDCPAGDPHPSILCLRCGMRSHHPKDVLNRWCGNCESYVGNLNPLGHLPVNRELLEEVAAAYRLGGDSAVVEFWQQLVVQESQRKLLRERRKRWALATLLVFMMFGVGPVLYLMGVR